MSYDLNRAMRAANLSRSRGNKDKREKLKSPVVAHVPNLSVDIADTEIELEREMKSGVAARRQKCSRLCRMDNDSNFSRAAFGWRINFAKCSRYETYAFKVIFRGNHLYLAASMRASRVRYAARVITPLNR